MKNLFYALLVLVLMCSIKVYSKDQSPWAVSVGLGSNGSTQKNVNSRMNIGMDLNYQYNNDVSFFVNGSYNPLQTTNDENDYYCITALGGFRYMVTPNIFTEFGFTMNEFENSANINAGVSAGLGGYTNIGSNIIIGARGTYNTIFLNTNTNNLYSCSIFTGYNF